MANTMPDSDRSKANEAILRNLPHLLDVKDEETFVSFEDLPGNPFGEVSERIVSGGTWFLLGQIGAFDPWHLPSSSKLPETDMEL
jgi:hypothetical protein